MSRDDLTRMDVDTNWAYHHRTRDLQRAQPDRWPVYWCAYLGVLAESWRKGTRVTLERAWVPAIPTTLADALAVLVEVGLLDRHGRIPPSSWQEWAVPALDRIAKRSDSAKSAARTRWDRERARRQGTLRPLGEREDDDPDDDPGPGNVRTGGNATALRGQSVNDAPRQPRQPSHPRPQHARAGEALPDDLWRDGLPHLTPDLVHQAEQLVGMTFLQAGAKVPTALDTLVERHGTTRVSDMLASVASGFNGTPPSWPQLVYGARNALEPIPGQRDMAQAAKAVDDQAADRKRARSQARSMAYYRGDITESELQRLAAADLLPGEG